MLIKFTQDEINNIVQTISRIPNEVVRSRMNDFFKKLTNGIEEYNKAIEHNFQQRLGKLKQIKVIIDKIDIYVNRSGIDTISKGRGDAVIQYIRTKITPCLKQCEVENGNIDIKEPAQSEKYLNLQVELLR